MHKLLPIVLAAFLAAPAAAIYAQSSDGAAPFGGPDATGGAPDVPGGLIPDDDAPGPVANVDAAEHKFDGGFYDKIRGLMAEAPTDGDPGVYDGERYYNVLIVVGRVYSSPSSSESTAQPAEAENDGPEIAVLSSGTAVTGNISIAAGQQTSLDVRVSDPDGDAVTITAIPDMLPASAISVADGGDGTATVTLSAVSVPAGTYVFWISASDGKESEREPFVVVVK